MRFLLALAAAMLPFGAIAAPPDTGSLLRGRDSAEIPDDSRLTGNDALAVLDAYAACLVKHRYLRVKKALQLPRGAAEQFKLLNDISTTDCLMSGELRYGSDLLMGSLYKALVQRELASDNVTLRDKPLNFVPSDAEAGGDAARLQFIQCVVRRNPRAVHDLLLSRVGTPAEHTAMRLVRADLTACVEPTSQFAFNKAQLNGLLAEVYYRSAVTSLAGGAK